MIFGSANIEVIVISPRKYINVTSILASHFFFMSALVALMNTLVLVFSSFFHFHSTLDFPSKTKSFEMGGEPRKHEPKNCKAWKAKTSVWKILQKGNVTTYLE